MPKSTPQAPEILEQPSSEGSKLTKLCPLIIITAILSATISAGGVYWWLTSKVPEEVVKQPTQVESLPGEQSEGGQVKKSEIVSVDDVWNKYINRELGFSIKIPKEVYDLNASCVWREEEDSYRPGGGTVPLKVFEEGSYVYLLYEYYYDLTGDTERNGRYYYSGCDKVENTPRVFRDPDSHRRGWKLIVENVGSESELNTFIRRNVSPGCYLEEMKPALQEGVYDVTAKGDPVEGSVFSTCGTSYVYALKYYPEGRRAAFWILGQGPMFLGKDAVVQYDREMEDSFRFE